MLLGKNFTIVFSSISSLLLHHIKSFHLSWTIAQSTGNALLATWVPSRTASCLISYKFKGCDVTKATSEVNPGDTWVLSTTEPHSNSSTRRLAQFYAARMLNGTREERRWTASSLQSKFYLNVVTFEDIPDPHQRQHELREAEEGCRIWLTWSQSCSSRSQLLRCGAKLIRSLIAPVSWAANWCPESQVLGRLTWKWYGKLGQC